MKYPSKIDVPVLIIFHARHTTLSKVFESIKTARPSTLLLWQDGPRPGNMKDIEGIQKCRHIFDNIDWECRVHTNYHDNNMGCDPSTFRAQKWAFSIVDKCIVLEDDMVPNQSFYSYCKELLDKYEFDERINHICGVNFLGIYEPCPNDYLFSYYGTGAWASWRRVAEGWDPTYSFLDDKYYMNNIKKHLPHIVNLKRAQQRRETGYEWWEILLAFNCYLNNRIVIIPKYNLVSNIGVEGGTHSSSEKLMSKTMRRIFNSKTYELGDVINHPKYIVVDYEYMDELSKINCKGRPVLKFFRKIEYLIRCIIYGEVHNVLKRKWNKYIKK